MFRVGYVIDGRLATGGEWWRGRCGPMGLLRGMPSNASVAVARFAWMANGLPQGCDARYELFRPWRRYDAVVFLKSITPACVLEAIALRERGPLVIADLDVDYVTEPEGVVRFEHMVSSPQQRDQAVGLLRVADRSMCASEHLADVFRREAKAVAWLPDVVDMTTVPANWRPTVSPGDRPRLLWCGVSHKLVDLLAAEEALRAFRGRVELRIITNGLEGLSQVRAAYRRQVRSLLDDMKAVVEPYRGLPSLLTRYAEGGISISPRHLDHTYNLGHSAWKILLPMACGRPVLLSPLRSYLTVARRNECRSVQVCRTHEDWLEALERAMSAGNELADAGDASRETVEQFYSARVVAQRHLDWVRDGVPPEWSDRPAAQIEGIPA